MGIFAWSVLVLFVKSVCSVDIERDTFLRTPQLILNYGYPLEIHRVQTRDGYILEHHRIPFGRVAAIVPGRPVVILHHGFMESSSCWILQGPEKSLGYILADLGYDVWLFNSRGNEYSANHVTLNTSGKSFWDFSWHEIGASDLPDTIDYILLITNKRSLFHIGHSQGTSAFYIMASLQPEYNQFVKCHISYSPTAFRKYTPSVFYRAVATLEKIGGLKLLTSIIGDFQLPPSTDAVHQFALKSCRDGVSTQRVCANIYFLIHGNVPEQLNKTLLPVFYGHFPSGVSIKQFAHTAQNINSDKFRQFDYRKQGNLKRYNSVVPPDYNISNIVTPVYTFYGGADTIADPRDVKHLHELLPNLQWTKFLEKWGHMDYLMGIGAFWEIYVDTINILGQYDSF